MSAFVKRTFQGLEAYGPEANDLLERIKVSDVVEITTKKPRNIRHHQKYWALCNLVAKQVDSKSETISDLIKLKTGHANRVKTADGTIYELPGSISFAAMDQTAFEQFYEHAMRFVCTDIIPNLSETDLKHHIEQLAFS